jgi:hypothetical protein
MLGSQNIAFVSKYKFYIFIFHLQLQYFPFTLYEKVKIPEGWYH